MGRCMGGSLTEKAVWLLLLALYLVNPDSGHEPSREEIRSCGVRSVCQQVTNGSCRDIS